MMRDFLALTVAAAGGFTLAILCIAYGLIPMPGLM